MGGGGRGQPDRRAGTSQFWQLTNWKTWQRFLLQIWPDRISGLTFLLSKLNWAACAIATTAFAPAAIIHKARDLSRGASLRYGRSSDS